jgi:predicted nucleic acid-binding protein
VKGIADTGVLVAFANANDAPHSWATQIVASVTAFHLEARRWLSQC